MQVDALALRLRPRTPYEAADLGTRLCQASARDIYKCFAYVAIPVFAICLATVEFATWLPLLALWWVKPWLDRTILFVLSRSAFGQDTRVADLWRAQADVWWHQFFFTWTIRRLSIWRSFTQPVYQLEGLSIWRARARVRQIRRHGAAAAFVMTQVFAISELLLTAALFSLFFWFAPPWQTPDIVEMSQRLWLPMAGTYAISVLFLEPFYVAAGFAIYLNRRTELEAWDIEQEFRRAFAN